MTIKRGWFELAAERTAKAAGSAKTCGLACIAIIVWGAVGPIFHFSDAWQLSINTSTTIITFLMVFLIQNTTNRESKALAVKIDELLRANDKARNELIGLEEKTETEIARASDQLKQAAKRP